MKKLKSKEIKIKRIGVKFDIKIIWNKILRDGIKNKIQIRKEKKNN